MISLSPLSEKALHFAAYCHRDQVRKYTGEPYLNHCIEVASWTFAYGGSTAMICAAFLHDVIEDCGVQPRLLHLLFGSDAAEFVVALTDYETPADGNRQKRQQMKRDRFAKCIGDIQTVKVCDLISNSKSIMFFVTWLINSCPLRRPKITAFSI
jgi:(p)ppGpp synthase/HD superfamily hydrolase